MTVLHTQRSYKRAHKFVLHSSDQVSNPGIELPSLAEGIYQSRFVDLLVGSSGTLGFVSRAPHKCNEGLDRGEGPSHKIGPTRRPGLCLDCLDGTSCQSLETKKRCQILGPWVIFAGTDGSIYVSNLWFRGDGKE